MRGLVCTLAAILIDSPYALAQAGGVAPAARSPAVAAQADTAQQQEMLPAKAVADAVSVYNARTTTRLTGDSRVAADSTVAGHLAVLNGQLTIAGHVRGRVVAINSDVVLEPTARVDEDILVIGGVVGRRENGRVRGSIRTYRARMVLVESGDSIVPDPSYTDEGMWWSRLQLDTPNSRSKIAIRGETYNRVEGLPILIGPTFRRTGSLLRMEVEALGIIRSADRFRWDSDNLGHLFNISTRLNRERGIGIGGSLYDVVEPVEKWHLSDNEAGLSTFALHRDFRDHYARHGGSLSLKLFRGYDREVEFTFAQERWRSRDTRDTWTLFRDDQPWRANPAVHEGSMHVGSATLRVDTRNSETNPWTGWFVDAAVERGEGELAAPAAPGILVASRYSRTMIDFRRYNRISARGQFNVRLVYGARLGEDELPLQKRFSVGGPGSLPGFDFRRVYDDVDVGTCTTGTISAGQPALCERLALLQLEYRGDIGLDLFDSADRDEGDWRDVGRHPGAQWVVFADAGRGWLVSGGSAGEIAGLTYPTGTVLPRLGTFRTDVGAGLDIGAIGLFVAKAVSHTDVPANFFVRLRHRF